MIKHIVQIGSEIETKVFSWSLEDSGGWGGGGGYEVITRELHHQQQGGDFEDFKSEWFILKSLFNSVYRKETC